MGTIFISYRQDDTMAVSEQIYTKLCDRFGRDAIYKDKHVIPKGVRYDEHIDQHIPIHKVEGYKPDPFAPPDPYFFLQIYGREQFPLALEEQTLTTLKVVADKLMRDNPGTKPTSKAKKDAVIAYIVGIVTGEGA